ncbi:efflux RND transporter periplasmic adaptor subun it [Desulfonema ishimotonii]|uniref:Efflux RND transporter periplasmic adaptor subun it n=1 Tax=Desulfonema ishimotonii TaxID=45657 RepID=A0A401FUC2_9BACT|nr:efflux RND transporter periplasmic adaptor subunit [Desulfonema ishimotonii]GBC60561.1 efflux RND transporter periplasmic adaptor subun it [Desulfonema ishimotonii]
MRILKICGILLLMSAVAAFAQEQPPAKVRITKVIERSTAENAALIGVLYFDRVSSISTEVAGLVKTVHFREGDRVKKGDVLININTDFLDKDIALEKMRIEQIAVRIRKTRKNLARYKELFKNEAASEIDYDDLNFSCQEQIKEQETLRQGLAKIELRRSKCVIRAPYDGIILEKNVDAGNWVIPGGLLCRIGSADDLFVKVPVPEKLVKFNRKTETVDVLLNASGEKLTGKVEGILPVADAKTKNVFVKIRLGNISDIPAAIAENMSAAVYVATSKRKSLMIIPRDALVRFQGKDFVYTVKEGRAAIVPISIVAYMGTEIGVSDPQITAGMPVVIDGNERLRPDQPVLVTGEEK